jgi:hypothetical protein
MEFPGLFLCSVHDLRHRRIKQNEVFWIIDHGSGCLRLIPYLESGFGETEQRFLGVLYQAIARRGNFDSSMCWITRLTCRLVKKP